MSETIETPISKADRRAAESAIDLIFREARTHFAWQPIPVSEETLKEVYELAKLGPTSANNNPLRVVFVTSPEGKERLLPTLSEGNVEKSRTAPVVAIFAYDSKFYEHLPRLFPLADIKGMFESNPELADRSAFLNSSLQAAYFMLAARAVGLDCGPMAGFDADKLNAEFFPDGRYKVNFVCNLGYGDSEKLWPRLPRLDFEEATQTV